MILSSSLVGNHNLGAESVFGTSQNGGLGDVWGVFGDGDWVVSGWCLEGCLWWEGLGGVWWVSQFFLGTNNFFYR